MIFALFDYLVIHVLLKSCSWQIHEEHPDNIESLQYLEALCKDLGRSHEEYSKKLEKPRRSQPQAAVTQQAGGTYVIYRKQYLLDQHKQLRSVLMFDFGFKIANLFAFQPPRCFCPSFFL